mgnify:CR=1 FL=1
MPVYVDPEMTWPTKIKCFKNGSSHLFADTEDELHAMAKRLGLKREWFQDASVFHHYDLSPAKRILAVKLGVIELERNDAVMKMREIKGRTHVGNTQQAKNAVDHPRRSRSWR